MPLFAHFVQPHPLKSSYKYKILVKLVQALFQLQERQTAQPIVSQSLFIFINTELRDSKNQHALHQNISVEIPR